MKTNLRTKTNVDYEETSGTFYEDQTDSSKVGGFRAWYHRSRYSRLRNFIQKHYRLGFKLADFGCGNCIWNEDQLPVVGVDINEAMLKHGVQTKRLQKYILTKDLSNTPFESESLDLVVMSEVLEHMPKPEKTLAEIFRVLKPEGKLLLTVPWDFIGSPFFILFNINCLIQGYLGGSEYHRNWCGHIQHFTKSSLRRLLDEQGFQVNEMFIVNSFLIYCSIEKKNDKLVDKNG